jgi:hypothetical protein
VNGAQRQTDEPQGISATEAPVAAFAALEVDLPTLDDHDRVAPLGFVVDAHRPAERLGPEAVIVTLAVDSGFKYMSMSPFG